MSSNLPASGDRWTPNSTAARVNRAAVPEFKSDLDFDFVPTDGTRGLMSAFRAGEGDIRN